MRNGGERWNSSRQSPESLFHLCLLLAGAAGAATTSRLAKTHTLCVKFRGGAEMDEPGTSLRVLPDGNIIITLL